MAMYKIGFASNLHGRKYGENIGVASGVYIYHLLARSHELVHQDLFEIRKTLIDVTFIRN